MADVATYVGVTPVTIKLTAAAVVRGTRVTRTSTGACAVVAASTARGDYILLQDIPASGHGLAAPLTTGRVPALTGEAVVAGDLAYTFANGVNGKTSAGCVVIGRWAETAASGKLGVLDILPAA